MGYSKQMHLVGKNLTHTSENTRLTCLQEKLSQQREERAMGKPGYGKDTPGSFLLCLLTVPCAGKVAWCSRGDSTLFGFGYARMAQ